MANESSPPVLFGSAGQPLRRAGSQKYRSQGVRSQNRSGLDELNYRRAGLTSEEARQAAIDTYGKGSMFTDKGELVRSDIFNQGKPMAGAQSGGGGGLFQRSTQTASNLINRGGQATQTASNLINRGGQATQTPRERFRSPTTEDSISAVAGIDPENLRNMAKVEPFKPTPKPQIMPATASDAASGRVDTMGPEGSPSQITSKYGTASITSGPRVGKAMTRDTFAGRNVPLKEWLRQRRAAQAERGIA